MSQDSNWAIGSPHAPHLQNRLPHPKPQEQEAVLTSKSAWRRFTRRFVSETKTRVFVVYGRGLPPRGAGDGIRTHGRLLGKQMRYHCATPAIDTHPINPHLLYHTLPSHANCRAQKALLFPGAVQRDAEPPGSVRYLTSSRSYGKLVPTWEGEPHQASPQNGKVSK
jgi:hypothetical protein